jgi:hypothetical protein
MIGRRDSPASYRALYHPQRSSRGPALHSLREIALRNLTGELDNDKEISQTTGGKTVRGWLYALPSEKLVGNEEYCSTKMSDM